MTDPGPAESRGVATAAERTNGHRVLAQLGGVSGIVYSSLPVMTFVPVSSAFGLPAAVAAALGVAALILLWRLIRRDSVQPAVSGFFGVALCALIAFVAGESRDYFLLGIWTSLFWAVVFLVSVLSRRPLVGYIWSWASGHDRGWRRVRRAVLAFDVATSAWVLVFAARFVVQRLLYEANQPGLLAVARIMMGWPLTAVSALVTYLAIKAAKRAMESAQQSASAAAADSILPPPR
jgi:hypothetical protein